MTASCHPWGEIYKRSGGGGGGPATYVTESEENFPTAPYGNEIQLGLAYDAIDK